MSLRMLRLVNFAEVIRVAGIVTVVHREIGSLDCPRGTKFWIVHPHASRIVVGPRAIDAQSSERERLPPSHSFASSMSSQRKLIQL